jgi:hypothetical protein
MLYSHDKRRRVITLSESIDEGKLLKAIDKSAKELIVDSLYTGRGHQQAGLRGQVSVLGLLHCKLGHLLEQVRGGLRLAILRFGFPANRVIYREFG